MFNSVIGCVLGKNLDNWGVGVIHLEFFTKLFFFVAVDSTNFNDSIHFRSKGGVFFFEVSRLFLCKIVEQNSPNFLSSIKLEH